MGMVYVINDDENGRRYNDVLMRIIIMKEVMTMVR